MVIQQNSRKVLMMDILMSETCWAHKKWNKIASDIKLIFYSSTNSLNVLNYNFSKEQYMFPEDERVIETCRNVLNILM